MRTKELDTRDRKLLELLAKGMPNAAIAKRLGYKHGSTRVYLHNLYRKIGVAGKTAAVVWYFDQAKSRSASDDAVTDDSVGDMAIRIDPFTALGAMGMLLGPYGKVWSVGNRLKGAVDFGAETGRRRTRALWLALLKGDFAHGKAAVEAPRASFDSPADAVLAALLLYLGGHAAPANRVRTQLSRMKRVPVRDVHLVDAVRDLAENGDVGALERIHRIASDSAAQTPSRHIAMAALFHAYKAAGDLDAAKGTAEALWAEADVARRQLAAMGERPFAENVAPPRPTAGAKQAAPRHKEAITAR